MLYYLSAAFVVFITIIYSIGSVVVMLIDRSGRLYHTFFRQWSRMLLWAFRIKVSISGTANIDTTRNHVFLANHASYLDIPVLAATIPQPFRLIFKEELTKVPIWGWALNVSPHIKIRRTDARDAMGSIERAAGEIREGASVVIFPEGTRTPTGRLGEFKRGGLMLATKSGVPLVPVAIRGTYPLLSRHDSRVKPGKVEVEIGRPVEYPQNLDRAGERALQAEIRSALAEMIGETEPVD